MLGSTLWWFNMYLNPPCLDIGTEFSYMWIQNILYHFKPIYIFLTLTGAFIHYQVQHHKSPDRVSHDKVQFLYGFSAELTFQKFDYAFIRA